MLQGLVVQLYPNNEQIQFFEQSFGNARYVWNEMLNMWNTRYQNNPKLPTLSKYDLNRFLPRMKQYEPFLKESESSSLQFVCETLHDSFVEFFKKSRKYPRFKAKHKSKPSFTMKNNKNIELDENYIKLPKIGYVKARYSNDVSFEKIKRVTISRTSTGTYKASVLVESESQTFDKTGQRVGLDVGMSDLIIGSDGLRIPTKRYDELDHKLKQWQRKQSRRARLAKQRGVNLSDAKNYQKAKRMVAKIHQKIRNSRKDYLHKVTTQIVKDYDYIAVEDLRVRNMMRNPNNKNNLKSFHHRMANQSWYELALMLTYKAERYGKTLIKVDPRNTSKMCSHCSAINKDLTLSDRSWICSSCGSKHDRDINAGQNILNKAFAS